MGNLHPHMFLRVTNVWRHAWLQRGIAFPVFAQALRLWLAAPASVIARHAVQDRGAPGILANSSNGIGSVVLSMSGNGAQKTFLLPRCVKTTSLLGMTAHAVTAAPARCVPDKRKEWFSVRPSCSSILAQNNRPQLVMATQSGSPWAQALQASFHMSSGCCWQCFVVGNGVAPLQRRRPICNLGNRRCQSS